MAELAGVGGGPAGGAAGPAAPVGGGPAGVAGRPAAPVGGAVTVVSVLETAVATAASVPEDADEEGG